MDLEERQRKRQATILAEAHAAIAEADKSLALANQFFNGEGAFIKQKLESLSPQARAEVDAEVQVMMESIKREAAEAAQRKMFEHQKDAYKPSKSRRLV
ncbi:MAG: hypothetical protein JWP36_2342 [Paucimonas sp.]|nr:hypothetical protein [Paucimonas sp.]